MERMRQRDAEQGVHETPPSDSQKAAIAEARQIRASKIAEREILHRATMARTLDASDRERLDDEYRRDLQRLNEECERKLRQIRST